MFYKLFLFFSTLEKKVYVSIKFNLLGFYFTIHMLKKKFKEIFREIKIYFLRNKKF